MHEAHRLHLALDGFGHELFDFERRGARVGADQRRTLDDEYRVLLLAQRNEAQGSARQQDEKEKPNDFSVLQ
jgi:hypothetical protein